MPVRPQVSQRSVRRWEGFRLARLSFVKRRETAVEIGDQIGGVFQPDRQADRARADAAGLLRIPDPPQSTELLIGMLLGLELIRLLYGQPAKFTGESLETHVEQVVDRFLSLHGT